MSYEIILLFLSIILLNYFIFKNLKRLSKFINVFDKPDFILKKHRLITPLLGGTIFLFNFVLIIISITFYQDVINVNISLRAYISIIFLIISFFFLGLIDDKFGLAPEKKILMVILISIIILSLNEDLRVTNLKFSFYENYVFLNDFSYFFSIFCILILINSFNFYDGINGQSIIFFIICFSFLALRSPIFIIYISIIFVLMNLLVFNLIGKIFMGDNGIYLVGSIFIIAVIYEYNVFRSIEYADEIFFLLALPGYDLVRLTLTRIYNGKNAFYGDRMHIHHLLLNRFSLMKTNIILFFLAIIPILLNLIVKINFFVVLLAITIMYLVLVSKLKNNDKKYPIRKKK
jgi:UDP-GlcNAc:undecaprenyl-phosphate GlcNAc-1-phosphate transferase